MKLADRRCAPCRAGTPPVEPERAQRLLAELVGWRLEGGRLRRALGFADFLAAVRFVDAVAALAEEQGHHPDLHLHDWNQLDVTLSTHAIGGLSDNDFVLAAHIDRLVAAATAPPPVAGPAR
jgi:4a-hydroxytetrahydrobiopterin dehydratase